MNIKNIVSSAGLVTSLLLSASSQALVMSDSTAFIFGELLTLDTTVDDGPVINEATGTFNLSRFDPGLGVLTSATLGLESEWVLNGDLLVLGMYRVPLVKPEFVDLGTSDLDHDGAGDQFDEHEEDTTFGGAGGSAIDMDVALQGIPGSLNDGDVIINECEASFLGCVDADITAGNFSQAIGFTSGLDFFTGTDPLEFLLTHQTIADLLKCGGKCAQTASSAWGGKLYVEYTYDEKPVPEPSILGLLGLGLLGVTGASAFKRRRG